MELRCQLERHTAALYADRAPVITNRRADAVLSFYLARARKPLFHHPPTLFEKGKFEKFWEEISGIRQRCMRENSRKIWDEAHSIPHRYARMTLKQKNLNTLWSIFACVVFFISLFHICKIFLLIFFLLADKYTLYNISRNGNQSRDEWRDRYNNYRCRSFDPLISW